MTTTPAASLTNSAQARATRQSAVITLMGAGSARTQTADGGAGFAETLSNASEKAIEPFGIFSETPVAAPEARVSVNRRTGGSKNDESQDSTDSPQTDGDRRSSSASSNPRTGGFKPSTEHGPGPSVEDQPDSVSGAFPNDAVANAALPQNESPTSPQNPDAATGGDDIPVTGKTRVSGASDPLRLIPPQNLPTTDGATPNSEATPSANGQPVAGGNGQPNGNGAQTNGNPNAGGTANPRPPVQSSMTVAATNGIYPSQNPQNQPPQGGQAPGSPTTNGNPAGGNTKPVGGIDQNIAPFRIGGGRLETPISLKLRATPATPNSESLTQTEADSIAKIVSRNLSTALSQKTPLVTLWMTPETLGKVKISLTFDQGTVSAKFEATSEATRDLLQQNSGALREALESRGLRADKIEVVAVPDWTQPNNTSGTTPKASSGEPTGNGQQPGSGQPGNGQPGSGQPGNGQPGNGQPGNGQSPNGQPNEPVVHSGGEPSPTNPFSTTPGVPAPSVNGKEPGTGVRMETQMDARLIMLNARLELDAVA